MTIKEDLVAFKNNIDLRTRFINYITDTTIDLTERWETYLEAPHDFLEHRHWIVVFNSERLLDGGSINWYEDFGVMRCQVVDIKSFINQLCDKGIDDSVVHSFKEEILHDGLGSFVYDW